MVKYISSNSPQYFAFNVWSIPSAKAVMDAASQLKCDIILQTSMKAFQQLDIEEFHAYVKSYSQKKKINTYLHLDHCRTLDWIHTAIEYGWDSVMIDASDKPLDENIRFTNEVADLAARKGVLVEAEVGQIRGQEDEISSVEAGIARMEDIDRFVKNTRIDMLAAAIGTVHGQYKGVPNLHYQMISEINEITDIPFVIHGGSGLSDEILSRLLSYRNVKKINISTEVKLAYKCGIEESIYKNGVEKSGFDPLVINSQIHASIQNMTTDKLRLLGRTS